eukprot:SAG31_NODE_542_length_14269_cov_7.826253_8_plen_130_part_00
MLGSTDSKAAGGQAWAMAATAGLFLVLGFTSGGVVVQLLRLDKLLFGGIIGGVFCALATVVALLLGEHGRGDLRARLQPWRPLGLSLVLLAVLGGVTLTAIKVSLCPLRVRPPPLSSALACANECSALL